MSLSEQEIVRRENLEKILEAGFNPFPAEKFDVTAQSVDIKEAYDETAPVRLVSIAGRLMMKRVMGESLLCGDSGRFRPYPDLCVPR